MSILAAISMIDAKIAKLKETRELLAAEFLAIPPTQQDNTEVRTTKVKGSDNSNNGKQHPLKGRKLSPEARKHVLAAIQRRVQERKAAKKALENGKQPAAKPSRPKPRFTEAGLKRLSDAAKKRWKAKKRAGIAGGRLPSKEQVS